MIHVEGLAQFERRIERALQWQKNDATALKNAGKRALDIFVKHAKSNIKDFPRDIEVIRKSARRTVYKGTLRRSIGWWAVKRGGNYLSAGPRAGFLNRQKFAEKNDAWFAHIVEAGRAFGRNNNNPNKGVIERSMKSTEQSVSAEYAKQLKIAFPKYMR